jgi:hypothetical protein
VSENKVGSDELEHYQRFPPFFNAQGRIQNAEFALIVGILQFAL